jgi:hypothetical protein
MKEMPQAQDQSPPAGVVCDRQGPDAPLVEAYLRAKGLSAQWYALHDLDDADRDVIAGRLGTVVFVRWQNLLEGIWNGEVSFDRWVKSGVDLRFVESPGENGSACLETVSRAWAAQKRARRRRQTVSGIILSIIAIAAAFITIQT